MKKKCIPPLLWSAKTHKPALLKVPVIMKSLFYAYLLSAAGLTYASDSYSQTTMVSINMKNQTVKEVLSEIENTTEYSFFYNNRHIDLNRKVSVSVSNGDILEVLDDVFSGTNVSYTVKDKSIIFSVKEQSPVVSQNEKKIIGTIVDQSGTPIIGANVMVKGTTNGTITDMDGKFTLNVPAGAILQVSYIGYTNQEVKVGKSSNLSITLKEDTELLDEVVVVGYGTMKKSDLTGAIAAVKGDDLAARKTTQLTNALQGAVSGVLVTRSSGEPGSSGSIKVRGVTSMGSTDPLVIIDGVPGNINDVSPEDVESLNVLKDAASCSIYGARAAAGVVVITTKRAKESDLSLNYQYEYGLEIATKLPEYVTPQRYMELYNEMKYNDNPKGGKFQGYSEDEVNNWISNNKTDPNNYPITDWTDLMMRNSAPRQKHVINLTGGNKNVRSKVSFVYDKVEGLTKATYNYDRFMIRTNNDFIFNKYIGAELDFNYKRSNSVKPYESSFYFMRIAAPTYAALWDDGRLGEGKSGTNPYGQMLYGGSVTSNYNKVAGRAALNITPIEGLKISAIIAPSYNFNKTKTFRKKVTYTAADDPTLIIGNLEGFSTTKLSEGRNDDYNITIQGLINYNKTFNKHSLNLMAGYETYYSFWENLSASRDMYELVNYPYLDLGPQTMRDNGGNAMELAYRSYFGRAVYSFNNKYLLQANIRYDGSSRFHKDSRWGTFPSFSAGWVISEENFVKKAKLDWLSFLKLRASYGTLGNERISGYYPYQAEIAFDNVLFYQNGKVVSELSAAQYAYAIQNISWEKTTSYDIGLDLHLFDNRLKLTADYYKKKTSDMLLALEIPDYVGFDNPQKNTGKMYTQGYDLDLSWSDNIGELTYSVSANLSDFVSRMEDLGGTQFLGSQVKMEGSEFNEWYGYLSDGLFLTEEDLKNSPKLNKNSKVGDIKYKDISGPDGVPDGIISPEYDKKLLGGSLPRYNYGGRIALGYKGIDFSMAVQGVGKRNSMLSSTMMQPFRAVWGNVPSIIEGNYWSSNNSDEQNAEMFYPRITSANAIENYNTTSDYYMFNGRYFRLKNITLGYTLPKNILEKVFIKNARLYVSANDIFCISNYPKGWDPEMGDSSYPITTSLLFGVSLNF